MKQTNQKPVAESRAPDAVFPLDGCDMATVSNERLLELIDEAPRLHELGTTKVVRLSQTLVMKGGASVLPSEAKNMEYAAPLEGLRLPKVHRSFYCPAPPGVEAYSKGYIVMDYVEGSSLADLWPNLDMKQRQVVITQVAAMIRKMQSIPLGSVGPVGGGMSTGLYFTAWRAGPFENRRALEDWFNHKLQVCKMFNRAKGVDPFEFPTCVFIHGDIAPRNVIVDSDGLVSLIDWQNARFYPPQFEAATIAEQDECQGFAEMLLEQIEHDEANMEQLGSIWYVLTTAAFM